MSDTLERITCRNVRKVDFAMACQIQLQTRNQKSGHAINAITARRLLMGKARVDVGVTQGIGMHLP